MNLDCYRFLYAIKMVIVEHRPVERQIGTRGGGWYSARPAPCQD
jgi:hypothetical protein